MTDVKERPILFSAPMVEALLRGEKTQTRRIIKPQPEYDPDCRRHSWKCRTGAVAWGGELVTENDAPSACALIGMLDACPYGKIGDRLWVRETHGIATGKEGDPSAFVRYYADGDGKVFADAGLNLPRMMTTTDKRPSIHMPRWASRITLEITQVRVQRLQDIDGDDARDEGIWTPRPVTEYWDAQAKRDYRKLWEAINGAESWGLNPWVWAVSFKILRGDA